MNYYTLITGASSGIGLELARIATREKRNLVLVARDEVGLKKVKAELLAARHSQHDRESSGKSSASGTQNRLDHLIKSEDDNSMIEIFAIDLSLGSAPKQLYDFCKKKKLNVLELINNAGFGDYGVFSKSDLSRQLSMIDLNIRAVTELTHLFLPDMINAKAGRVMNVGSVASFLPGPLMSVYFASKNYVLRFSEALAEELSGSGVTITCLCPASTKTNFGKNARVSKTHSTANPKTTARDVAEFGWYHMQSGTRVAIHGFGNRVVLQFTKFVPRRLLGKLVKKVQR